MARMLNMDDANIKEEELTVEEIRADDEALTDKVYGWLDEAQGEVYTGKQKKMYLVIEITA